MGIKLRDIFGRKTTLEMSPVRDRTRVGKENAFGQEVHFVGEEWDAPEGTMVNGWKVYRLRKTKEGIVKVIKMEEVTDDGSWIDGRPDRLVDWEPMDLNLFEGGKISDEDRVVWIKRIAKVRPWVTREKIAQTLGVSLVTIKRDMKNLEEQKEMAYWGNSRFGHWIVGKDVVLRYSEEELARHK